MDAEQIRISRISQSGELTTTRRFRVWGWVRSSLAVSRLARSTGLASIAGCALSPNGVREMAATIRPLHAAFPHEARSRSRTAHHSRAPPRALKGEGSWFSLSGGI